MPLVVIVVVGPSEACARSEADEEKRWRSGSGVRAEAIINNWELIKVPDKSMESVACVSSLLVSLVARTESPFGRDARALRYD